MRNTLMRMSQEDTRPKMKRMSSLKLSSRRLKLNK